MFENLTSAERIKLAKQKLERVLDHFLYLLELHANNAIVVHSPTLSSQIPTSFAANAFNVFQRGMHQFEIVRLCALWDRAELPKENIPTIIELIDDEQIIQMLADETRQHWTNRGARLLNPSDDPTILEIEEDLIKASNKQFGDQQAANAEVELKKAIADARSILATPQLAAIMNLRDKHLAHSLSETRREQKHGPIEPVKFGDETVLLQNSIPIVEHLYCWVNGKSFSIDNSQSIDKKNAEALWYGCKFEVLR